MSEQLTLDADMTPAMPGVMYRLAVSSERAKPTADRWFDTPASPAAAPMVSAALHDRLTRSYPRAEDKRVTFHGGHHAIDLSIGLLLCDPDPAVRVLGEEWLGLIRWVVAHTRLTDFCQLIPTDPQEARDGQ